MTRSTTLAFFTCFFGVASFTPGRLHARLAQSPVDDLKRLVDEREVEFRHAQMALAVARARLARAEGRLDLAAAEWRKVIPICEADLKSVETAITKGRYCGSEDEYLEARGVVSVARVGLADAERSNKDLLTDLPKAIAYFEQRQKRYQTLLGHGAIAESEARQALKECADELRWARERRVNLQNPPPGESKPGKDREGNRGQVSRD
jgi:hypothetical protein